MLNIFRKVNFTRSFQNVTDRASVRYVGYRLANN